MSATYSNALQEMLAVINTAWQGGSNTIIGYVPEMRWPLVTYPTLPPSGRYWGRVSTQMVREGEGAAGKPEAGGKGLWDSAGLLFVQCFGPITGDAQVRDKLTRLAELARDAYSGQKTASGVWFRNCRLQELNPDGKFQQIKVTVEFQYLSIR